MENSTLGISNLITAQQRGDIPEDGGAQIGTVRVAHGHRIFANQEHHPDLPPQGWGVDELEPITEAGTDSDADSGTLWLTLAEQFPRTGLWPICGADDEYLVPAWERHNLWRDKPAERPTDIRGLFGLDHRDEWDIQEDGYCFECGVVNDRTGELRVPGARPDLDTSPNRWDTNPSGVP